MTLDPYCGNCFDPKSMHKYLYAGGDPVNGRDPSGMLTLIEVSLAISIRNIMEVYTTGLLLPVFFRTIEIAECVIAPATEMRQIALSAISNGAGEWAFNMEGLARAQIAFGYRSIGKTIAGQYKAFFEEMATNAISVDRKIKTYLNLAQQGIGEGVAEAFPTATAVAGGGALAISALKWVDDWLGGVIEAANYWRASAQAQAGTAQYNCGRAKFFAAVGDLITRKMVGLGRVQGEPDVYRRELPGISDEQYTEMVRQAVLQIRGW